LKGLDSDPALCSFAAFPEPDQADFAMARSGLSVLIDDVADLAARLTST
jgi:hypothetical protein